MHIPRAQLHVRLTPIVRATFRLHALVLAWQMIFEWNPGAMYGITGISRVREPWNPSAAPTLFPGLTPFKGGLSGPSRKDPGAPFVAAHVLACGVSPWERCALRVVLVRKFFSMR